MTREKPGADDLEGILEGTGLPTGIYETKEEARARRMMTVKAVLFLLLLIMTWIIWMRL